MAQVTAPVDKTTVVVDVDKSSGVGLAAHDDCVYLCGNSLGLQPRAAKQMLLEELDVWARRGVHGHVEHDHGRGWVSVDDLAVASSARIVGMSSAWC